MINAAAYRHGLRIGLQDEAALKLLLCHVNGYETNNELLLHWSHSLKDPALFDVLLTRLLEGEPIQYLIGTALFDSLPFHVDESVLIPRPETEELVLLADEWLAQRQTATIVDLGTGSGCIAIALKKRQPRIRVLATDIAPAALDIARGNAVHHGVEVEFMQGDWLRPLIEQQICVDLIVANPPYIESHRTVSNIVLDHEPHLALFAAGGTFNHQRIMEEARHVILPRGRLMMEIDEDQPERLAIIAQDCFKDAKIEFSKDLQGKYRFIIIDL